MLIYMTKHRAGQWSLEAENGLTLGAVVRKAGRLHLSFCGVQNQYGTKADMRVTLSLLGHRLVERNFVPRSAQ